jgi:hypothetical protein
MHSLSSSFSPSTTRNTAVTSNISTSEPRAAAHALRSVIFSRSYSENAPRISSRPQGCWHNNLSIPSKTLFLFTLACSHGGVAALVISTCRYEGLFQNSHLTYARSDLRFAALGSLTPGPAPSNPLGRLPSSRDRTPPSHQSTRGSRHRSTVVGVALGISAPASTVRRQMPRPVAPTAGPGCGPPENKKGLVTGMQEMVPQHVRQELADPA